MLLFTSPKSWHNKQHSTFNRCASYQNKIPKGIGEETMNIFSQLKMYAGKWNVVDSQNFSKEEIDLVSKAEVVDSQYGHSVCFFMKAGGQTFIPLSTNSSLNVGDSVDLSSAKLLRLHREGEADIYRVEA